MKIIFFGNTKYSLIGAKIIHEKIGISQIVTIPDRPDKRGRLIPSPLKIFGEENNIPVLEVNKITDETIKEIETLKPDFFVVEDYGLILPSKLLAIPKIASLNIHHSLLPKYRGSSPAPTAILNGDEITGVTVIKMAEKVDAGDILTQEKYAMKPHETTDSLLTILNELGGNIIIPVLQDFAKAEKNAMKQDENKVIFTKMMTKQDGYIDLTNLKNLSPLEIENWKLEIDRKVRAYFPWPTVWTRLSINGQTKIVKLLPENKIQVEGKNPMTFKDFLNGYPELREKIEKLITK